MKSFSEELADERTFEIGNETFKWRYPHWEEMAAVFDEDQIMLSNGGGLADITTKQDIELAIKRIQIFLEPDQVKRFVALTKRKEDAVPLFQYRSLYRWLLEVTSGRPTMSPSASAESGGDTGASSPEESPSQEETPTP